MTDYAALVERLRKHAKMSALIDYREHVGWEAADALEALQAEKEKMRADCERELREAYSDYVECAENAEAENERLRHRCRELDFSLTDMLAEIERLRTLLDDKQYVQVKADYNKGHLSHAGWLEAREQKP